MCNANRKEKKRRKEKTTPFGVNYNEKPSVAMPIHCMHLVVQVLEAVLERLQDFEDKVRSHAIIAICEAAMASPEVSPSTKIRQNMRHRWLYFCGCAEACSIVSCTKHKRLAC